MNSVYTCESIYVKRKLRIRTILGFCCANLGSVLCAIILGLRMQTSDVRICCANLGSADFSAQASLGSTRNHLGSRNLISAIHGNKPTIDCAHKAARLSVATNSRSIVLAKQLRHPRQRTLDQLRTHSGSAGYNPTIINHANAVAITIQLAQSIVGLLPRMAEVWLRDPR